MKSKKLLFALIGIVLLSALATVSAGAMLGDANGNGKIDAKDYMMVKRHVLGTYELTGDQLTAADVNGNGKIDAKDYMMVKRHVLGTYTIEQHTHVTEHHAAVNATCIQEGNTEYWSCTLCQAIFADSEGKNEITLNDTVIGTTQHTAVAVPAVDPGPAWPAAR